MGDATLDEVNDDPSLQSIADSELPDVRRQARDWLIANNRSDQISIAGFAAVVALFSLAIGWWPAILAGCILLVIPFRWMAAPHFRRGDLRRGILWANLGSWYLLFPLVIILPDTLPIAMQNVIGPVVLAATYLDRQFVRRSIPPTIVIAVAVTLISFTTDGVGVEDEIPRWLYLTVLLGYVGANMMLVMRDVSALNGVHLRSLQHAVRSNRELRAADGALRDSRRRLLVAADEERVRLERDLHDGAQQQFVSLSLQLRLAAELAEEGRPPSSEALMAMHNAATDAVDELRDLAQGVYPARIHELGLVRALRSLARRSPVVIDVIDETGIELDESTRVALYFVCVEAIQNATKHGGDGTTVTITLNESPHGDVTLTIQDDGRGFDPSAHAGSRGLLNMADRVGALGGSLDIDSAVGTGTTIVARLPAVAMVVPA